MAGLNNLGLNSAVINVGTVGAGLAQSTGLLNQLEGQPGRVQFIQPGIGTVFQFDATISESHNMDSAPTAFPLEDGSVISDHIIQAPVSIQLTGVVSDTPLPETLSGQVKQTLGNAAASLIPPLGVSIASTAYAIYSAGQGSIRPSKAAYNTLTALRLGNPNSTPPTPPVPFTVLTKYKRYESMIIVALNFPVDASTDGQCVFTVTLAKMTLVTPQRVKLSVLSNAALAAQKVGAGEQDAKPSGLADGYKAEKATGFSKTANAYGDNIEKGLSR